MLIYLFFRYWPEIPSLDYPWPGIHVQQMLQTLPMLPDGTTDTPPGSSIHRLP